MLLLILVSSLSIKKIEVQDLQNKDPSKIHLYIVQVQDLQK